MNKDINNDAYKKGKNVTMLIVKKRMKLFN